MRYIVAKNRRTVENFVRSQGLDAGEFVYVSGPAKLVGANGRTSRIDILSDAPMREDYAAILAEARRRGFDI
ncbi:hypothetical protein [uncultured Rhodospira sp.]|uniref:hypothetical protein n=1 Tax=uncultured Rhodospira sp. TaxID=1936189 RepID=UPI002616D2E7|nr:hypothetical protein [uncultured Rhodospira sp.]